MRKDFVSFWFVIKLGFRHSFWCRFCKIKIIMDKLSVFFIKRKKIIRLIKFTIFFDGVGKPFFNRK